MSDYFWRTPANWDETVTISTEPVPEYTEVASKDSGYKHDDGKSPLHLIPFDVMFDIADVMKHGAKKYPERN